MGRHPLGQEGGLPVLAKSRHAHAAARQDEVGVSLVALLENDLPALHGHHTEGTREDLQLALLEVREQRHVAQRGHSSVHFNAVGRGAETHGFGAEQRGGALATA